MTHCCSRCKEIQQERITEGEATNKKSIGRGERSASEAITENHCYTGGRWTEQDNRTSAETSKRNVGIYKG